MYNLTSGDLPVGSCGKPRSLRWASKRIYRHPTQVARAYEACFTEWGFAMWVFPALSGLEDLHDLLLRENRFRQTLSYFIHQVCGTQVGLTSLLSPADEQKYNTVAALHSHKYYRFDHVGEKIEGGGRLGEVQSDTEMIGQGI